MPRVEDAISINNLIGDNSLELIGYYEYNGVTNPVYQQNYIDGTNTLFDLQKLYQENYKQDRTGSQFSSKVNRNQKGHK